MDKDSHPGPGDGPAISSRELRELIDGATDAVAVLDEELRHLYANEAYAERLGYAHPARLIGEPWETFLPTEEARHVRTEAVPELAAGRPWREDLLLRSRDGSPFSRDVSLTPLGEGRILCIARSLGNHELIEERLERMAYYDPLTELANRRLLDEKARQAMALALRSDQAVGLIYLDLNGFKAINDSLGHGVGDRTLTEVARRLERCVREADTAARVGGDEFAVLLGEVEGEAAAVQVAQRILNSIREPIEVEDHSLEIGASIGLSFFPRYASDFDELMHQADLAMYGAGREKRVGVRIYRPEQGVQTPRHARLVDEIHRALERYQLTLHYQPVRELATDRLVGAQALVRWPHPRLGTLSAAKFVPLVEEAGLVRRMDRWVLASAALQLRAWSEAGFDGWVGVHISDRTCKDPELTEYLRRALLAAHPVDPARLVLELPADYALEDHEAFVQLTRSVKETGASVAVNAFEADTASTAYLREAPPELLHLGPTLSTPHRNGSGREQMLRTVVGLAHSVGTRVVAKGVERGSQRQWLEEMGCDLAQGYLVGWSVPPEEFLERSLFDLEAGGEAVAPVVEPVEESVPPRRARSREPSDGPDDFEPRPPPAEPGPDDRPEDPPPADGPEEPGAHGRPEEPGPRDPPEEPGREDRPEG